MYKGEVYTLYCTCKFSQKVKVRRISMQLVWYKYFSHERVVGI